MLGREAYERARAYLLEQARPLERALFRTLFEGAGRDAVLSALASYQNDDGGFGNAIEPDFRLPDSSPMATSEAFHALRDVEADDDLELVRRALSYLCAHYEAERPGWRDVPASVNDFPHAPWWHRAVDSPTPAPPAWGNPDADIVAALHEHRALVPAALLEEVTSLALHQLDTSADPLAPYVSLCYLRLARAAPHEVRERIAARLRADARRTIDLDPDKREANHFQPFWLAPSPDALLADLLAPEVVLNLDAEIERQQPAGFWEPRWSWAEQDPEAWEIARRDWRGRETLRTLRTLRAYGQIDSP